MRLAAFVAIAPLLFAPLWARADELPSRTVLARFTTTFQFDPEHHARAFNVELAAGAIDGRVIAPGATFSFNDRVGERTAAFGYAKSIVLRDGMIAEGAGGGTCQVASTLHAAALLAGLDIVSRTPHSRPSAYIRMGFDATVVYPRIDLRLRNPRAVPVVVRAKSNRGALEVRIEADGATSAELVSVTSEIVEWMSVPRVVQRDKSASDDTVHVRELGIPGFRVRRTREITGEDGVVRRDFRIDVYPPTAETVRVAPSFDLSRLEDRTGVTVLFDAGVVRPALVQLRPSTVVVMDNR